MIAALFVETGGCYYGIPDVDPWDIQRDARLYDGTDPVVAHPPCERWGRFAEGSPLKRGYKIGDDGGCFATALAAVRRCGGVLEHPSHSKAWDLFRLQKPRKGGGWTEAKHGGEWACEVEQGHYGHRARKSTWLLFVGPRPWDLIWGKSPQRLPQKRLAEKGYKAAVRCGAVANMSHKQRQRTPHEFRDVLLSLARFASIQRESNASPL